MQGTSWLRPTVFPIKKLGPTYDNEYEDYHNVRLKKVDSVGVGIFIYPDNQGDVVPLNVTRTGVNFYNRVGNKINLKKLTFRGFISSYLNGRVPFTGLQAPGYGGFAIVYDLQPNGTTPTWRDVFEDVDENGVSTITPDSYSSINWINRDRFIILYNSRQIIPRPLNNGIPPYTITGLIYPDPSSMDMTWWFSIDLSGLKTVYNTMNIGTALDIMTGAIWLLSFGTRNPQDNQWAIEWRTRLYFEDL